MATVTAQAAGGSTQTIENSSARLWTMQKYRRFTAEWWR